MQKTQPRFLWWDWASIALLFILLQTVAARLFTTKWTPFLYFIQTFTTIGLVLGLALGYSQFKRKTARWISFGYMLIMVPLIWARVIDEQVELDERLLSVGGRLLFSISEFFARQPVKDPLFFVAIMSISFWIISASAGFTLIRNQNFIATIIPSTIGILVIQHYDNLVSERVWLVAFFIFIALFLLGRLNFLQDQTHWRERRVFLSSENSLDLTSSMIIAAGLIIITAWTLPLSLTRIDTVKSVWNQITKPWTLFTERMKNAVSALDVPPIAKGVSSEFYGTELQLGRGFPLSNSVMFQVKSPTLSVDQKPPRYYWQGRTYDYFANGQWYTTGTTRKPFSPDTKDLLVADTENHTPERFIFTIGESKVSLLYAPAQPVWFSRPGSFLASPADTAQNITAWDTAPALLPGETYQVDVVLNNPTILAMRNAGTQYPPWVTDSYLQIPKDFSTRITTLAKDITAQAQTPYDKADAITNYLRTNIKYAPTIPDPPRNADPLEWVLFDYKKAYCVYYASSEVLMLRSLGIPARVAVGFTQGTPFGRQGINVNIEELTINSYIIRQNNAHAWPEVYFPNIGWVEFEPTGNQAPLDRPLAPLENADSSSALNPGKLPKPETDLTKPLADQTPDTTKIKRVPINPIFYLLPLLIAFATLTIYLSRRYNVPARMPMFVRTAMERTGVEIPTWVIHWERWVTLTPVGRSFESINFALRQLNQPAPIHATPVERASSLANALPHLEPVIKVLLDEHQTSLYTSRVADDKQARRAAFQIRRQVIIARIQNFWIRRNKATITPLKNNRDDPS